MECLVPIESQDFKGLTRVPQMPKPEGVVIFLVPGLTVFVGLIEAVLLELILACILLMKANSEVAERGPRSAALAERQHCFDSFETCSR